nr:hypothetical protein [Escherichia coli]
MPLRKNTPVHGLHIIPWWQPVNFPAPPVERGHEQSGQKPPVILIIMASPATIPDGPQ